MDTRGVKGDFARECSMGRFPLEAYRFHDIMHCQFSSLVDLLRRAAGNTTPTGNQLTNIRKLVTGGVGSGSSSSASSS